MRFGGISLVVILAGLASPGESIQQWPMPDRLAAPGIPLEVPLASLTQTNVDSSESCASAVSHPNSQAQ